jgi:SAM-dependent methyltransferase
MKQFLHVGCARLTKAHTTGGFNNDDWREVRFDIDPDCVPDIVGTIVDMSNVADGSFDAIFSSHNLEHVYPHEVQRVILEFARVLTDDGFVVLTCPDLQTVCETVAQDKLLETVYVSPLGPIAPIDILFGHRALVSAGKYYMAHKCGFTFSVLANLFVAGGFKSVYGGRRPQNFDLWIIAFRQPKTDPEMQAFGLQHLPS